jgi:hypothetical protein
METLSMTVIEHLTFLERVTFALEWKRLTGWPLPIEVVSTRINTLVSTGN